MSKNEKITSADKTELSFKMMAKNGRSKQVSLSLSLDSNTQKKLSMFAKKNKLSEALQARWIIMTKYHNWDLFVTAAQTNCRSMNMEAKKIITDYFSPID
jgi:hypothetical protein